MCSAHLETPPFRFLLGFFDYGENGFSTPDGVDDRHFPKELQIVVVAR
jgi:hypothetical protein